MQPRTFALLVIVTLLVPLAFAGEKGVAVSKPTYTNEFLREPNYTLDISKVPYDMINPPKITQAELLQADVVLPGPLPVRLDPRTCPGQVATCYQVLANNKTIDVASRGVDRTNLGIYSFPYRRVRLFSCVGNDRECIAAARGCWCSPGQPLPSDPLIGTDKCSDTAHLCENAPGFFVRCVGNLTQCREQYGRCACGMHAACTASQKNACANTRDELITCSAGLADCLKKYDTCSCGTSAITTYWPTCTQSAHRCVLGAVNLTCHGSLQSCALQFDKCWC